MPTLVGSSHGPRPDVLRTHGRGTRGLSPGDGPPDHRQHRHGAAHREGDRQGRHQVLPHPQVREYAVARATDTDAWVRGMQRLQRRYDAPPRSTEENA